MALQVLISEGIEDFEIWENSPRLPKSVQTQLALLSGDEKMKAAITYYVEHEELETVAGSISSIGFFVGEALWGIARNGSIVIADGARRFLAAYLLLNPELTDNEYIKTLSKDMKEDIRESLKFLPVIIFHSGFYSLEAVAKSAVVKQFQGA